MFNTLKKNIENLETASLSKTRKGLLKPLIEYLKYKSPDQLILLNFICTHNSRRSIYGQVWAQTMAEYFNIKNIKCYSGGTEATVLFPKVTSTLKDVGFKITVESNNSNPIYKISFSENASPILGFSKKYDNASNPESGFAAIMTCSEADADCPIIKGAEKRIAITYQDPKVADNTPNQEQVYAERSKQIATEMKYVFENLIE